MALQEQNIQSGEVAYKSKEEAQSHPCCSQTHSEFLTCCLIGCPQESFYLTSEFMFLSCKNFYKICRKKTKWEKTIILSPLACDKIIWIILEVLFEC